MDVRTVDAGGKMMSAMGDASGAIGIVCGLLLIGMYLFVRYLMESAKTREAEMSKLNQQMQEALVINATAMTALAQALQRRTCLATSEVDVIERIGGAARPPKG